MHSDQNISDVFPCKGGYYQNISDVFPCEGGYYQNRSDVFPCEGGYWTMIRNETKIPILERSLLVYLHQCVIGHGLE